jgi:hypothetical protein
MSPLLFDSKAKLLKRGHARGLLFFHFILRNCSIIRFLGNWFRSRFTLFIMLINFSHKTFEPTVVSTLFNMVLHKSHRKVSILQNERFLSTTWTLKNYFALKFQILLSNLSYSQRLLKTVITDNLHATLSMLKFWLDL